MQRRIVISRVLRAVFLVGLFAFAEIFLFNDKWINYRITHQQYTAFSVSSLRLLVYLAVLAFTIFYENIKPPILKAADWVDSRLCKNLEASETIRPERIFVRIALVFGILAVFLTPPLNVPDEAIHFEKSVSISQGHLFPTANKSGRAVGLNDNETQKLIGSWPAVNFNYNAKISYSKLIGEETRAAESNTVKNEYNYLNPGLCPIMYAPQAIGITVGNLLFHVFRLRLYYTSYAQMTFARLFNLLYYMIMIYFCIRATPVFKRTLTAVALMPMALFQAASCSYDVYVITSCLLFVTMVFKLAFDPDVKRVRLRHVAFLAVTAGMLSLAKYVYVGLLLLLLIIPTEKFGKLKQKIRKMVMIAAAAVAVMGIWLIINKIMTRGILPLSTVPYEKAQLKFMLHNPIKALAILIMTPINESQYYLSSFVGTLGWLDTLLPNVFTVLYLTFLLASALLEHFSCKLKNISRLLILVSAVVCFALIVAAEYITWTPLPDIGTVGLTTVLGFQGRYLIPFALVALMTLASRASSRLKSIGKLDRILNNHYAFVLTASLTVMIYFEFLRYWLP